MDMACFNRTLSRLFIFFPLSGVLLIYGVHALFSQCALFKFHFGLWAFSVVPLWMNFLLPNALVVVVVVGGRVQWWMPFEQQVSVFYIELMKPRGERMLMHLIAIYFISLTILSQLEFMHIQFFCCSSIFKHKSISFIQCKSSTEQKTHRHNKK